MDRDDRPPDPLGIGADDRIDVRFTRVRRVAWLLLVPMLVAAGVRWEVPGSGIGLTVPRTMLVYLLVLVVLRLAGKRTLGEMNTFDLAILLIVSEAVQPALVGDDHSLTNAALILLTLVGMDALLGFAKDRSPTLSTWLDDVPAVLLEDGQPREQVMRRHRVDVDDLLQAARQQHGLLALQSVRYAILERGGNISIIPGTDTTPR